MRWKPFGAIAVLVALGTPCSSQSVLAGHQRPTAETLTVTEAHQIMSALLYIALAEHYFAEEGSALMQATHYIQQHPDESQSIVARHVATTQHDWDVQDFSVQLDSFLARSLTAHAVVIQGGRQALPDFQRYFYYQRLPSALRAAVIPTPWEGSTE